MPLAMSNVLQAYTLIFRRDGTSPLYITSVLHTQETPIFLVYDPSGPGHYDSAILYTDTCTTHANQKLPKPTKCSCGVNKKEQKHKHLVFSNHTMKLDACATS